MPALYSGEEAQIAIREVALMLLRLLERLEEIAEDLPRPADPEMDAMLEGSIPMSLEVDLLGSLEIAANDGLRPAIQTLEQAVKVTPEDLRREFDELAGGGAQRDKEK